MQYEEKEVSATRREKLEQDSGKRLMKLCFFMEKAVVLPFIRWIVEMSIPISLWEWNLQKVWAIPLTERITGWFMQHRGCQRSR